VAGWPLGRRIRVPGGAWRGPVVGASGLVGWGLGGTPGDKHAVGG